MTLELDEAAIAKALRTTIVDALSSNYSLRGAVVDATKAGVKQGADDISEKMTRAVSAIFDEAFVAEIQDLARTAVREAILERAKSLVMRMPKAGLFDAVSQKDQE